MNEPTILPLARASLCVNCQHVVEAHGERCPACGADHSLLNLSLALDIRAIGGQLEYLHGLSQPQHTEHCRCGWCEDIRLQKARA